MNYILNFLFFYIPNCIRAITILIVVLICMKSDLKKYKDYIILFSAQESNDGSFYPIATLFKAGEKVVSLDIDRSFFDRDQALSFAIGASEETINALVEGNKTEFRIVSNY